MRWRLPARIPTLLLLAAGLGASCGKVPIVPVNAGFLQADAAWFEEEETLFFFWEVTAEQGLGEPSLIEATWLTDDGLVDWVDVQELDAVHTHLPVDCGTKSLCGSMTVRVQQEPRNVALRLRYHRDGELALDAPTVFNVVAANPDPSLSRSLLIYGVFDEENRLLQWRGRHQFPTVRNERATALGLRRWFRVEAPAYGLYPLGDPEPYAYGSDCSEFTPMDGLAAVQTEERAIFAPDPIVDAALPAASVCATATTTSAVGEFATTAVAFKNPEVRPAFPEISTPIREALVLPFFLAPCDEPLEPIAEAMQRQRLLMDEDDVPTTCIDDWDQPGFVDELTVLFRTAVEDFRPDGRDMVLVVGLHRDDRRIAGLVEEAMVPVVTPERHRTSPRLAGAFVFDADDRGLQDETLAQMTLWCPSTISLDDISSESARSCPVQPDIPDVSLGPVSFNAAPILPTNEQYLDFVESFSVGSAGEVEELHFLTPELSTTTDHVDLGAFGMVTFLDGEAIDADADDAFSYCSQGDFDPFVLRSALTSDADLRFSIQQLCAEDGGLSPEICQVGATGLLPLAGLPEWHGYFAESRYEVGLFWQFPYLLRMNYRVVIAGAVSSFGFSVPFGIGTPAERLFGGGIWTQDSFSLDPLLTQCRRFCDHPTFDDAGVYHPTDPFRDTYPYSCYLPRFPEPGDSGFPRDP